VVLRFFFSIVTFLFFMIMPLSSPIFDLFFFSIAITYGYIFTPPFFCERRLGERSKTSALLAFFPFPPSAFPGRTVARTPRTLSVAGALGAARLAFAPADNRESYALNLSLVTFPFCHSPSELFLAMDGERRAFPPVSSKKQPRRQAAFQSIFLL